MHAHPWFTAAVPVVSGVAFLAVGVVGFSDYSVLVFRSLFYLAFPLSAGIMTFVAARRAHPADRRAWALMAMGVNCLLVGEVIWAARQVSVYPAKQAEAPLSDFMLILGYVLIGLFVFLLLRERFTTLKRLDRVRYALDGLIVLLLAWSAEAILVLQPWLDRDLRSYGAVSLAFSFVDLLVVAGFVVVVRSSGQMQGRSWQTLAMMATALGAVSHMLLNVLLVSGAYQIGSTQNALVDLVWMASYWIITMAAARFAAGESDHRIQHVTVAAKAQWSDFLPVLAAVLFIPASMWVAHGHADNATIYWAWVATASLLTALVAIRGSVVAVSNRELTSMSATDPLTGVHNHRYFREHLDIELSRAMKTHSSLSVVALDIDDFRRVNELHGHLAGDQALQLLAHVLTDGVRSLTDLPCRIGGDEFAVLLPAADANEAAEVCERIRSLLAARQPSDREPLTLSAGIASFPAHAQTRDGLLRAADAALYRAKDHGRDLAVVFDPKDEGMLQKVAGAQSVTPAVAPCDTR